MGPLAVPVAVGLGVGGVASSFIGGRQREKAAHEAANITQEGARVARGDVTDLYGKARDEFSPWLTTGIASQNIIADLSGANGPEAQAAAYENFKTDPSYRFRVEQANKGYERSALARGNLFSGNFATGLADINQGLASQGYGDYYNRLFGLSERGYGAAGSRANLFAGEGAAKANIATGSATNLANLTVGAGEARAGMYENMFKNVAQGAGLASGFSGGGTGGGSMYGSAGGGSGAQFWNPGRGTVNPQGLFGEPEY